MPTVPQLLCAHCSFVPTVPLCPLFLCSYTSSVPVCQLFLCAYCSSVPTVPLCLLFLCSSVPTVPLCLLFLCAYCSSVLTVPLCPLFLCSYCSPVSIVHSSVPAAPLPLVHNVSQVVTSVRSSYTSHKPYEVDSPTSNVSSPTPLNYRTQGYFCPYTHINYSSFFIIHCGAKQTAKYVKPELNAVQLILRSFIHAPYNLFLVLSSTAEPNEKVFWTLGPELTGI